MRLARSAISRELRGRASTSASRNVVASPVVAFCTIWPNEHFEVRPTATMRQGLSSSPWTRTEQVTAGFRLTVVAGLGWPPRQNCTGAISVGDRCAKLAPAPIRSVLGLVRIAESGSFSGANVNETFIKRN